jgi:hypothetical protein
MPRHRGRAIKKTRKPETRSLFQPDERASEGVEVRGEVIEQYILKPR